MVTRYKYVTCNVCREHRLWQADDNAAVNVEVSEWGALHTRHTGHDYWTGYDCADFEDLCRRVNA